MPDEDGYSLMARIRKLPTNRREKSCNSSERFCVTKKLKQKALMPVSKHTHTKPFEQTASLEDILQLLKKYLSLRFNGRKNNPPVLIFANIRLIY
jgi:hypothetical protein